MQMNRYVSIICIILAILFAVGFLAYNFLEIYDRETYDLPSAEVRSNDYLALQRWLLQCGHSVDTWTFISSEDILKIDEQVIVLDSLLFAWEENTFDTLKPWIENGKHLFVYHNYWQNTFNDEDFYSFVKKFDVTMITPDAVSAEKKNDDSTIVQKTEASDQHEDNAELISEDAEDYLYLDQSIQFDVQETRDDILRAGADDDMINLVRIPVGEGSVTFTGSPFFMQNNNLRKNKNRFLAWNLTGAHDKDKQGILFVQGTEIQNTFFQDLIHEGNVVPLVISIFILIVICFWGFIPRFGKIIVDEESSGKPLRERFLAEAIFLKKFHSLARYIDVYEKAIQQRFKKNYGEYIGDKKLFCIRLAEIVKLDAEQIEQSLYPKKVFTSTSFAKCMKAIEIILERL
jgi:hypothetical protein